MILEEKYLATPYRCAVYFVPDIQSAWWDAGSRWLGRCASTAKPMPQPQLIGISPQEQWEKTSEPRRYGWHATLKAPFKLKPGENLRSIMSGLQSLADTLPAFDMPPWHVSLEGGFMALRPSGDLSLIQKTAQACVKELHRYAAPLSQADLERRRMAPLTPEQDRLLLAWGYPYVFEEFKFHLSLTNNLSDASDQKRDAWVNSAQMHFANLGACRFDRMALFIEPTRGADFELFDVVEMPQ
jgi:hypothetical protein